MIEITIKGSDGRPQSFRFENDSLQAFLTEEASLGHGVEVVGLGALGVPIAQPKTAGPGAPREPVKPQPAKPASPEKK